MVDRLRSDFRHFRLRVSMIDYIRTALLALVICMMLGAAHAGEASFADLLARAHAQAAAGHRWEPEADNAVETIESLIPLLPTATREQRIDLLTLVDDLLSEKNKQKIVSRATSPSQDNRADSPADSLAPTKPAQAARRMLEDQEHLALAVPWAVPAPSHQDTPPPVTRQQLRPPKLRLPRTVSAGTEHISSPVVGQRCRSIILRAQLGEEPSDADRVYLRRGCRQD
jgi:hypothetical protein